MPNIFHQSVEDILKAATPSQKILWNHIFLRFGERISVSQYVYIGATAGELYTYNANKMYLAYEYEHAGLDSARVSAFSTVFYDQTNTPYFQAFLSSMAWDATAASMRYRHDNYKTENILFSRIVTNTIAYIKFVGYRIGI